MTAPDDAFIPDAVFEACFPAWNEQACNAGVHDNCDPDCPYDRPAQALRIAWRAVLASGAARAALWAALAGEEHGDDR